MNGLDVSDHRLLASFISEGMTMKKLNAVYNSPKLNKLPLHSETVRLLTQRELSLVAAGNCVKGSVHSQVSGLNVVGVC